MAMSDIILRDKSKQMGVHLRGTIHHVDEHYMCDLVLNAGLYKDQAEKLSALDQTIVFIHRQG